MNTSLRPLADRLVEVPLDRYLADTTCLSSSRLRRMLGVSPFPDRPDAPPTWPMRFGTWAHEALLEPETYAQRLAQRRAMHATVVTAASDDPHALDLAFKLREEPDDLDELSVAAIVQTVHRLPEIGPQLDRSLRERVLVKRDAGSGLWIRIRPDALDVDAGTLIEFKTVEKLAGADFMQHALRMGYDVQAGLYLHLLEAHLGVALDFRFIVAERTAPFDARVIDISAAMAANFRLEAVRLLERAAGDERFAAFR